MCRYSPWLVTLPSVMDSLLRSALQALSSARPASLGEQQGGGLGEVERFVPGEQAASVDAALPAGEAAVPVPTARRVGWAR